MRILFAGSPAIAIPSLKTISRMEMEGSKFSLVGILTNPDSRRGRGGGFKPTDISAAASELAPGVPQLKPEKLGVEARELAEALAPDLLVSFAYGRIFGPLFLDIFPFGGINIHPSLLPKYRGATPIPAAILAGDTETGICIQRLSGELDSGDILIEESFPIAPCETTETLSDVVSIKAANLLRDLLLDFDARTARSRPQQGEVIHCCQIKKEEGIIDWNKSAAAIDAQIRAYTPWPLSFTFRGNDRLFILQAQVHKGSLKHLHGSGKNGTVLCIDSKGIHIQTGDGILTVTRLQWQAKKALDFRSFCNGETNFPGTILSN